MSYIPGSLLSKPNPVKQLLEEGLESINEPHKWRKRAFELQGKYCAVGAARNQYVTGKHIWDTYQDAVLALINALPKKKGWGYKGSVAVYDFNDDPRTTHKQIVNLYKRAIKAAGATCSK